MRSQHELAESCRILCTAKEPDALGVLEQDFTADELGVMLEGFKAANPNHKFIRVLTRAYALKDLFFFTDYVLGYNKHRPAPDPKNPSVDMEPSLHGEMCKIVTSSPKQKRLFLVPRGHMKSTVLTVGHTIWLLCRNPNLRILIVSATGPTAESFLAEIKGHFDNNKTFRWLFPDRLPTKGEVWNQDAIQVGGRTIQAGVNSVEARGLEGNLVGRHYDYCKFDDLVTKDNITTPEQRQKVIAAFQALESVMEPYATWDGVGTRWHFYELYQWLIDANDEAEEEGVDPPFDIYIRRAIEDGKPIFAAKYTYERLMQIKATQKELYAKLYDNNPLPDEDREFTRKMFYEYTEEEIKPLLPHLRHRGTTVDLAVSQKHTADYSVVCTGTMHPDGNLVVLDINRNRVTADRVADWVLAHVDRWGSKVGYESQGQQAMFETVINLITEKKKRHLPMQKLKGSNNSNETRIRGLLLMGVSEKKPIWIPKDCAHKLDLVDEFERFPVGKHDDMAVAIAYLPQMVRLNKKGGKPRPTESYEPDNSMTGY
jgi:hypothetical protein